VKSEVDIDLLALILSLSLFDGLTSICSYFSLALRLLAAGNFRGFSGLLAHHFFKLLSTLFKGIPVDSKLLSLLGLLLLIFSLRLFLGLLSVSSLLDFLFVFLLLGFTVLSVLVFRFLAQFFQKFF
jgi:hypothetical protein